MPKVVLAKSSPPDYFWAPKVVLWLTIFASQKWSYAFSYSVTGK